MSGGKFKEYIGSTLCMTASNSPKKEEISFLEFDVHEVDKTVSRFVIL